jgi:hypothetical protein
MLLRLPYALSFIHSGVDLIGVDQFPALGGSIPLFDFGAVFRQPGIPVMEQFQRPLDNLIMILVRAGPKGFRNQPLVLGLQSYGHTRSS